ncbi:MAG TPA: DUF58 domain-containing protein [Candidatus Avichristensenella intestinipullorum]|uniref:DUF58 domain-containing protein n=1 Tax=Candidatus Avichristensenella intestinipullorum TaxID=2840693 RepID=A0A9D0YZZ4_9FIRM|nr:DUF58 domain-containing protein [Candidatus Avichristensenella intestinipullorum]
MSALWLLTAFFVLALLQSFLLSRFGLRALRYTRSFSRKAAFAGETVELVEVLRNEKPLPLPWLRAESRMSRHLRLGSAEQSAQEQNLGGDEMFSRRVYTLAPYSQVRRRTQVTLLRRGRYEVGTVALTCGDLLGLAAQTCQLDTGAAISVYPRLLDASRLDCPSSRWQGDLQVRRWIAPDPYLVASIRAWQPGDARRDVHWPATARMGALQVKAHDCTANPRLLVLLNVQRDEGQWNHLMEYEQGWVEAGISLAATLCVRALSAGLEAGFGANAPSGEEDAQTTLLLPGWHSGREEALLETMARLRILRARRFPTFLDELGALSGMDILILSAYDTPEIRGRMAMLRLRGNSVALWKLSREEGAA